MISTLVPRLILCLAGAAMLGLVACGQAGPLYLPGKAPQKISQFKKAQHRAEYGKDGVPPSAQPAAPAPAAPSSATPAPGAAATPSQGTPPPPAPPATPPATP